MNIDPTNQNTTIASEDFGTLNDAKLLTPFSLDDPRYAQEMIVSIGGNRESQNWKREPMSVAQFVALNSTHREDKKKDGMAFVLAEILGPQRKKAAVAACYGVGLDLDVGVPGEVIDASLVKAGYTAIRYTTHSHAKSSTKLLKDRITRWAAKHGLGAVDQDVIARFLREESRWDEGIIETIEYVGDVQEPEGFMVDLHHIPMPKHRVVLPLKEPFYPTQVAKTHDEGMKKWGQVCYGTAGMLGDLPLDRSAIDPSRLFYFPRHAPGKPFEISIVGGDLLDWKSLDLGDVPGAVAEHGAGGTYKSKSTTQEGRDLGRWSLSAAQGFQIADVIKDHADDRIRTNGAHKIDIECPFDEEHSDPGNPDDRGCFAVNAGEGSAPVFTLKCQHDSCSQRTNLDFLGKMLKDQWFDREVLGDPSYNAEVADATVAVAAPTPAVAPTTVEALMIEVAALTPDSAPDDVQRVIELAAGLSRPVDISAVRTGLKTSANFGVGAFDKALSEAKRAKAKKPDGASYRIDKQGVAWVEYFGEPGDFDHVDAVNTLRQVTQSWNMDLDGLRHPTITEGVRGITKMTTGPGGTVAFAPLSLDQFKARANESVVLVRVSDSGSPGPRKHLPVNITQTFYGVAHHDLPPTPTIVRTPLFLADGRLLREDGWHEVDEIYMEKDGFDVDPVPSRPSAELVEASLTVLTDELLEEFPFLAFDLDGNERSEPAMTNALAMILTPFMRRMIAGPTPMFFITKPTPGTGGTLLGGVPIRIFEGIEPVPMAYSPGNDEENQKQLMTAAAQSRGNLFYDDVKEFNARPIKQALTSGMVAGRRLGTNEGIEVPNLFNWIATGNNPLVDAEMRRRIVEIRLNAQMADIQNRKFKRDLLTWIPANRARLVHAILVLIQNWIANDKPPFTLRSRASFEAWAKAVGGVLQAAGLPEMLNVMQPAETDTDVAANRQFVKEWVKKFGFEKTSVAKLIEHAMSMELDVVEGISEPQKKKRLQGRIATMDGVTFRLGTGNDARQFMVKLVADDEGDVAYRLKQLELVEAMAVEGGADV